MSIRDIAVANVPPDTPPFNLYAVVDVSMAVALPANAFSVLLERKTGRSEVTLSIPHDGTIMEPVFVA